MLGVQLENGNLLSSITPSGFFGQSSDMILKVPNIVSSEEIDLILNTARKENVWIKNLNDALWNNRITDYDILQNEYIKTYRLLLTIQQRVKKEIEKFYKVKAVTIGRSLARWTVGDSQSPHADKESIDGTEKVYNGQYDIGCVVYLNNNYSGGELYFPQHDIEFKPEVGTAYAFPGDRYFLHGVREITEGVRYTIPIFWTITKHL